MLKYYGTSLVAQWLRLCAPNAAGKGSIPGQGTIPPLLPLHGQKKKGVFCYVNEVTFGST